MTKSKQQPMKSHEDTIARLEDALAAEEQESLALREKLEGLEGKLAAIEKRIDARVEEAVARAEKAELRLKDQGERLEVLGQGREESMLALNQIRDELALVKRDRDTLRRQLTAIESMQTETAALPEEDVGDGAETHAGTANGSEEALPSIEELMANVNAAQDGEDDEAAAADELAEEAEWKEMIAPEAIVAGAGARDVEGSSAAVGESAALAESAVVRETAGAPGSAAVAEVAADRMLVGLESEGDYPLTEPLTTIGRSESADVYIDGNFISRIHARILMIGADIVIEDAGSKNGIRINSERVDRHVLKDGDLIRIGTARFRYVDRSQAD